VGARAGGNVTVPVTGGLEGKRFAGPSTAGLGGPRRGGRAARFGAAEMGCKLGGNGAGRNGRR
jgi:hypothetical protein